MQKYILLILILLFSTACDRSGSDPDVDKKILEKIDKDKYIPVDKNGDLNHAFEEIGSELAAWGHSFYKVDYCPASQEGTVDILIKVHDDSYKVEVEDRITLPENIDFRCDL